MILKPKSTPLNERALVYKRYTDLALSVDRKYVYYTENRVSVSKYWYFNALTLTFVETEPTETYIKVDPKAVYGYYNRCYQFNLDTNTWELLDVSSLTERIKSSTVGKYQINKYYFTGSFDYVVKGAIEGSITQPTKGLITPLSSFNICYYDRHIKLREDDLVVIDRHLYSVENPIIDHKHTPKDYTIYFATLNSLL